MRVCNLSDLEKDIITEIKKGAIFIYPTDTLYGIGCNASKSKSVKRIRKLKKSKKPFSVIVPNKKWIRDNLNVKHSTYLNKLPGKYTLIFKKKRKTLLPEASKESLGVRIPKHEFTKLIKRAKVPFITTSVNVSRKKPVTKVSRIPKKFLKHVDFVINDGTLKGKASKVIDLTGDKPKKLR